MNKFEHDMFYLKYNLAKRKLETYIDILLEDYKYSYNYDLVDHTKSRIKDLDSAKSKLIARGYEESLDDMSEYEILDSVDNKINDMVGIRIVCPFTSDVLKVVELIKEENGEEIIIEEESDYITSPKPSGYSSYHLDVGVPVSVHGKTELVKCEIQVRTMAMDVWATLDHKLRYKLSREDQDKLNEDFIEGAKDIQRFDINMQDLKDEVMRINEEPQKVLVKK